jgi:hypothetical protein
VPGQVGGEVQRALRVNLGTAESYKGMSHEALVCLLLSRDETIRSFRQIVHDQRQKIRRVEKRLVVSEAAEDPDAQFRITRLGTVRLTHDGNLALGMRQLLHHGGAGSLGLCLLEDISRNTVIRSELALTTAWMAGRRQFAEELRDHIQSDAEYHECRPLPLPVQVVAVRSDATNSSIWQQSKLHNTEVLQAGWSHVPTGNNAAEFWGTVLHDRTFADLQPVASGSGPATYSMLEKQLKSIGAVTWTTAPEGQLTIFLVTSDGGSDQVWARRAIKDKVASLPHVFCIDFTCGCHDGHNVFKEGLVRIDAWLSRQKKPFRYFSTLAKLSNLLRSQARPIFL